MNTRIEVDTVTLPAYWASALVNDDWSGLDETETAHCRAAVDELAREGWRVVDTTRDDDGEGQDARFTWSYYLYDKMSDCRGGSVLDYVVHKVRS